jgi:hypothetical protein
MGDEKKRTVKFWEMPEVSLVAAWASTAAVLLLGVGVAVAIMHGSGGAPQGGAQSALPPPPVGVSAMAPASPPVADVPPATVPEAPPVSTPGRVSSAAVPPRPRSTVPLPKPEPAAAQSPVQQRPVRHPETASGVVQRSRQVRARDEMQSRLARSLCARWGFPPDSCDEAIQREQQFSP